MAEGIKIVTIGGGSSYTPELMEGFLKRYEELPIRELWLVDVEEGREKQQIIFDLCKRMIEKTGYDIKLYQTLDRREALVDADFVTTQFRVGQLPARAKDERIPLSHGVIGQETNGPGGLFKGLRTIPVVLSIIDDIKELCPDAWMINFANPAGMVTEAVNRFTDFKRFIGVCNVPVGMKRGSLEMLGQSDKHEQTTMDLFGLNHMVFMKDFYIDGVSKFDELIKLNTESTETNASVKNIVDLGFEKDFIKGLRLLPCPYHRYYYKEKEMTAIELGEFYKGETRAEVVMRLEEELFELYKDPNLDIKPPQLEKRGGAYYSDAACEVINAIYNDKQNEQYVNICNNGHIENIDPNWAIEISCIIGKDGAKPVDRIKRFDESVLGLISAIKSFEIEGSKAAVSGDYNQGLVAMNVNPLVHSDDEAKVIFDELLEAHKEHLPQFFKN